MASLEHTISRTLECSLCLELLSDPKQLSCTHTFCKTCLDKLLACSWHTEAADSLVCPICRSITDVKDGDVMNLNTNVPLKSLVDDLKNSQQLCEMCLTNSQAVHFCQDCSRNLCDGCLENHNKWPPHLLHKVVLLKDIQERRVVLKKKIYCQEHEPDEQELCKDVCLTCKKFICTRCRMLIHKDKGHKLQTASEYNASIQTKFQVLQAVSEAKAQSIKFHLSFTERQMKRVTDHIYGIYHEITSVYEESIQKLNESKAAIIATVDAQKGPLYQRLQKNKDDHERLIASLESASVLLGDSLKIPLGGDIIAIRDSLFDQLQGLIDRDDPDKQLVTDVADRAEELFFKPDKQDPLSIGNFYARYEIVRTVKLSGEMNSLAPTLDGRMAVGYSEGGIDFVSENGQVQQTVLTDVEIRVARFLSDGGYVVLDLSNNITMYTPKCVKSEHDRFMTLSPEEGGVSSLAVGSFDLIYVGYCKPKKIQEFQPGGGHAIREIQCNGFEPAQITCHDDSFILSYDTSTRIVGRSGAVKHRVKKSNLYSYATVTQDNSILIAWVQHDRGLVSIEKFTNKLKPIKTLISDHRIEKCVVNWYCLRVFQSGGIAFCTPNRLYIWACPQ